MISLAVAVASPVSSPEAVPAIPSIVDPAAILSAVNPIEEATFE